MGPAPQLAGEPDLQEFTAHGAALRSPTTRFEPHRRKEQKQNQPQELTL
jgi:hypothetical protein